MARTTADNFLYKAKKPLDSRSQFETLAEMKAFEEAYIPEGFLTYCVEDKKTYRYNSTNTESPTTGKWKEEKANSDVYEGYYTKLTKLDDYVYEAFYTELNYPYAYQKFEENLPVTGGCSSIRNGNFYGRNLDWIYNEDAEFIIHTPSAGGRYATLCTCGQMSKLSNAFVESGDYASEYVMLPFYCVDGINEKGVFINVNVVPAEVGNTDTYIEPEEDAKIEICANMIPRYVLDYCASAYDAVEFIQKHMRVYFSKKLKAIGYEPHFMIGDENDTYIVEFYQKTCRVLNCNEGSGSVVEGKPYMTNFHLTPVRFNTSGPDAVLTPETKGDKLVSEENGITRDGAGLERYNLIYHYYTSGEEFSVRDVMTDLLYGNAYKPETSPYWYTEFVGEQSVDSDVSEFAGIVSRAQAKYNARNRDPASSTYGTWQTTHSVVYDIAARRAEVIFQERVDNPMTFELIKEDAGLKEVNVTDDTLLRNLPEGIMQVNKDGRNLGLLIHTDRYCTLVTGEEHKTLPDRADAGEYHIFSDLELSIGTRSLVLRGDWRQVYDPDQKVLSLMSPDGYMTRFRDNVTEGAYLSFVATEAMNGVKWITIDGGGMDELSPNSDFASGERVELYYHNEKYYVIKNSGLPGLSVNTGDTIRDTAYGSYELTVDNKKVGIYTHHEGSATLVSNDNVYLVDEDYGGTVPKIPDYTFKIDLTKCDDEGYDEYPFYWDTTWGACIVSYLDQQHVEIHPGEVIYIPKYCKELLFTIEEFLDKDSPIVYIGGNFAKGLVELNLPTNYWSEQCGQIQYYGLMDCKNLKTWYLTEGCDGVIQNNIFGESNDFSLETIVCATDLKRIESQTLRNISTLRNIYILFQDSEMDVEDGAYADSSKITVYARKDYIDEYVYNNLAYLMKVEGEQIIDLIEPRDALFYDLMHSPYSDSINTSNSLVYTNEWAVSINDDHDKFILTSPKNHTRR